MSLSLDTNNTATNNAYGTHAVAGGSNTGPRTMLVSAKWATGDLGLLMRVLRGANSEAIMQGTGELRVIGGGTTSFTNTVLPGGVWAGYALTYNAASTLVTAKRIDGTTGAVTIIGTRSIAAGSGSEVSAIELGTSVVQATRYSARLLARYLRFWQGVELTDQQLWDELRSETPLAQNLSACRYNWQLPDNSSFTDTVSSAVMTMNGGYSTSADEPAYIGTGASAARPKISGPLGGPFRRLI